MKPVEVTNNEKLTINQKSMRLFEPYRFKFLDCNMVAVKTPNGVELLQELQYETDKEEINNETQKVAYPMGFMQKEITVDGKKISTKIKRIMVWINPKGGYHYHKENANPLCITKNHKLVRLDTIKRRKTFDDDRYIPCPACYGDLRRAK
jgi:hypothetical protein